MSAIFHNSFGSYLATSLFFLTHRVKISCICSALATHGLRLNQKREDAEREITRLDEKIRGTMDSHRPQAEIEEDIEDQRRKVASLESFRASLQVAHDVMTEAAEEHHRDFAPRLNSLLGDGLASITACRYQKVYVSPQDMTLQVQLPETGGVRGTDLLSFGTQDLCYLLLRIAIARLMSQTGERIPLIMDDPLVNLDNARQGRMLDALLSQAEDNQILIFTKNEEIRRWCEDRLPRNAQHQLILMNAAA